MCADIDAKLFNLNRRTCGFSCFAQFLVVLPAGQAAGWLLLAIDWTILLHNLHA